MPGSDDATLTFESYVTRADLKKALREHESLASVLGVDTRSEGELDALFEALDSDGDSSISRAEWRDFVAGLLWDSTCEHGQVSGMCLQCLPTAPPITGREPLQRQLSTVCRHGNDAMACMECDLADATCEHGQVSGMCLQCLPTAPPIGVPMRHGLD